MYVTGLAILLIVGIIGSVLARRLRISNILGLVLVGMLISNSGLNVLDIFNFPPQFLASVSLLALAMIVFDGSSRLTLKQLDQQSTSAIELVVAYIVSNILILGVATMALFLGWSGQALILALLFAVVMAGTDPGSVFILLGETKNKVLDFLKIEAVLNTPIVVIIPFLLLNLLQGVTQLSVMTTFTDFLMPFLKQIIIGIGAGMVMGIIIFKVLRRYYADSLSPIVVIAATVLAFVLAENLEGNGVLAVATLGVIFGNTYVEHRGELMEFSTILSTSLQLLVFLLIGIMVSLDFSIGYFINSLILFAIAVFSRGVAVFFSLRHSSFTTLEKVFMALNMPKGIAVAVVTLALLVQETQLDGLLDLMILFLVYSLILSSAADRFAKFFIREEIKEKEMKG